MIRILEYKWRVVALLFSVATVNYADRTAISAVFPLLRSDFGASDVALASMGSLFLWSYAIGAPISGYLADRVSRSRMVFWSLATWSLITLVTALVQSTNQLLATRVLLGFSESAYLPAAIALIADYHEPKSRGTAIGIHLAGLNFGLVAGGVAAGYLGEHFGWRLGFLVLGGAGLLLAAVTHSFLRDAPTSMPEVMSRAVEERSPYSGWQDIAELVRIPSFLIVLGEAMAIATGTWIFFTWLPLYFQETFQMSLAGAGFSGTFIFQMAATIGVVFGGYGSDKIAGGRSARRMLIMSLCYFGAAPFLLAFRGHPQYAPLSLCVFLYSLMRGLGSVNEGPIVCDLLTPRLRATAFGFWNMFNCFAGGVGILITGYVKRDYGLDGVFSCVSATVLLAACLALAGHLFFIRKDLARYSIRVSDAAAAASTHQ